MSERAGARPEIRHDVRITDTTLRDGSHAQAHQFTEEQVRDTVRALDRAGVEVIEVTHGDGLGGSSFNYGFSHTDELKLIAAAREEATQARIAVLLVPGIGTVDDLRRAHDAGAEIVRVATHCTEADVSPQHFGVARDLGMETVGFLMMAHRTSPEDLAKQARIMVDAGCQCPYVTDSAGALLMHDARARFEALLAEVGDEAWVGYHGHQNLSLGVANSVIAAEVGVKEIDGSLCALGAGSGNSPTEVIAAVFDRMGIETGLDVTALLDAAEDVVRPYLHRWPKMDRNAITQGWAGVYSSFLLHAEHAGERYKVPVPDILRRCGELGLVGGQEDMIIDIALELAREREQGRDCVPVLEVHLVEGDHAPASDRPPARGREPALRRGAGVAARARPGLRDAARAGALGGRRRDGREREPAPYFTAIVLEGRPVEQRHRLLAELTDLLVDVLGATRSRVRGRIIQVPPDDWAIGGVPASGRAAGRDRRTTEMTGRERGAATPARARPTVASPSAGGGGRRPTPSCRTPTTRPVSGPQISNGSPPPPT